MEERCQRNAIVNAQGTKRIRGRDGTGRSRIVSLLARTLVVEES